MDKEKLQQQVDEMKSKLAEMEALLNKSSINYWQPEPSNIYFYVDRLGKIDHDHASNKDMSRYRIFKTRAEAQKYADYIKAEETLKKAIAEANEGWLPNWNTHIEDKWCVEIQAGLSVLKEICAKSYKSFPIFMYIKSGKKAIQLMEMYEKEFITYLSY